MCKHMPNPRINHNNNYEIVVNNNKDNEWFIFKVWLATEYINGSSWTNSNIDAT